MTTNTICYLYMTNVYYIRGGRLMLYHILDRLNKKLLATLVRVNYWLEAKMREEYL